LHVAGSGLAIESGSPLSAAACARFVAHQSSDQRNRPEKLAKTGLWISFFRARPRKFFDDKVIGLASDADVDNSTGHYSRLKI
jgi:hypothetical protein